MKALRLHGTGDLRLHDEPVPEPRDGEVLVRVAAVGLCGSDRHWFLEGGIGDAVLDRPLVLGHEFVGTIESGARAGERVALDPAVPCGRCGVCLRGNPHLCPELRFAGHGSADGALRTRLAWPERLAHSLPDALSDAEGSLLEPLGVALHALDLAKARPGSTAGVFGLDKVWTMHLTVGPKDWEKMQPTNRGGMFGGFGPARPTQKSSDRKPHGLFGLDFEYVKASVEIGGKAYNDVGVRFVIPEQGSRWHFK